MRKASQLIFNHLSVVLLISVVFLSIDSQVLPSTKQMILLASSEASAVTYPYLDFSTYFGGTDGIELGLCITTNDDGCFYITGQTESSDLPIVNAYDDTINGGRDAFVAKFDSYGSLLWCTYLGGSVVIF
jgi:hypothetical protein